MATAVAPETSTRTAPLPSDLAFLDEQHPIWTANQAAWLREERRLYGGEGIKQELVGFKNEDPLYYRTRQDSLSYLPFPEMHASVLAGHLSRVAPMPTYGAHLGQVRERALIQGRPTIAEAIHYNADGIGNDGSQWHALWNGAQERAIATGHRWILIEVPTLAPDRAPSQRTRLDLVLGGQRPYLVEWAPGVVQMWQYTHGRLDWAVARVPVRKADEPSWKSPATESPGYYLFVRAGFTALGQELARGGWYLIDADKHLVASGDWERTQGQIPLVPFIAQTSNGTPELPAFSRSLTQQLGNISVSLMNLISARDHDAFDAAMSIKYMLGADPAVHNVVVAQHNAGSLFVGIPPWVNPADGSLVLPTIYDGSSGSVAEGVFTSIVASKIDSAHEIMARTLTSTPDVSGESKRVGFGEATAPVLSKLAARRETAENAALWFLCARAGERNPSGFVSWPTNDFDIAPTLTKLERTMARLKTSLMSSPTLEAFIALESAKEDGTLPPEPEAEKKVLEEVTASVERRIEAERAAIFRQYADAGAPLGFAARMAGLSTKDVAELEGEGEPGEGDPSVEEDLGAGGDPAEGGVPDAFVANMEAVADAAAA